MAITKDKLVSLLVYVVILVGATAFLHQIPAFGRLAALTFSLLGLILIWFAEPLGEIHSFSRGVALSSPPLLIEAFGWLFLVGYPIVCICLFATVPVSIH